MVLPTLAAYSVDALQAEIERRKNEAPTKPELTGRIELENLLKLCKAYIENLDLNGYVDEDFEHYIFEAAMQTFYGGDIFKYINAKRK
jgi:hypothetical protein